VVKILIFLEGIFLSFFSTFLALKLVRKKILFYFSGKGKPFLGGFVAILLL